MIKIVSLAWNKADMTREFLERLKMFTDIPHRLIFTDNGSTEPVSNAVLDVYPEAILLKQATNIGCPATRNPSMKETKKDDVVFWLDNDTMVEKGWYKPFLEALNYSKNIGIVGVDGRRVRNPFYVDNPWKFPHDFSPSTYVDWFVGYAMAFRRSFFKPIPDWNLMVNMDDVDLCMGIKSNGGLAKMLDVQPPLKHLGSETALHVRPTQEKEREVLAKWWEYWKPHSHTLEEYKLYD